MANQNDKTVFEPTEVNTNLPNEGTIFGTSDGQDILNRTHRKIAGILFSFSKNIYGEFWIVYHGRNTIGSGSSSNIRLMEKSVSEKHALLNSRVIDDKNLIFELRDDGSNVGTILNDKDLFHFQNYAVLKHGDRIKIGGYDLLFYVVDDISQDMHPNSQFKSISDIPQY